MTRYTPADEIGADDHDTIADRVTRGVAELNYAVQPVVLDVREQATGGAVKRPTLADIAIAIMICDAIDTIPGFGATWGYNTVNGTDRAYGLVDRVRRKSSSWPDAATKLRRMQHRRLAALAKEIAKQTGAKGGAS